MLLANCFIMKDVPGFEDVEKAVIELRGKKIILDSEVAKLYGVTTREINQAVKNNPEKFPTGYILKLDKNEKMKVVKIFDNLSHIKFSPVMPNAFTEKGLYMLATILKGDRATQTTIAIVETFAKIKELSRNLIKISDLQDAREQKSLMQRSGKMFSEILGESMAVKDTETSIELNSAVLKLKHTAVRKSRGDDGTANK